jgi:hypothetical protein
MWQRFEFEAKALRKIASALISLALRICCLGGFISFLIAVIVVSETNITNLQWQYDITFAPFITLATSFVLVLLAGTLFIIAALPPIRGQSK